MSFLVSAELQPDRTSNADAQMNPQKVPMGSQNLQKTRRIVKSRGKEATRLLNVVVIATLGEKKKLSLNGLPEI